MSEKRRQLFFFISAIYFVLQLLFISSEGCISSSSSSRAQRRDDTKLGTGFGQLFSRNLLTSFSHFSKGQLCFFSFLAGEYVAGGGGIHFPGATDQGGGEEGEKKLAESNEEDGIQYNE